LKTIALVRHVCTIIAALTCVITGRGQAAEASLVQQYSDPTSQDSARFGYAVSAYSGQPLVGAPFTTDGGHVYMYNTGASNTPIKTFNPPPGFSPRSFGSEIAVTGTQILISDPAALPLSGTSQATTVPIDATADNFRGVVVHYASSADLAPKTLINPVLSPSTSFGSALAIKNATHLAVGDPALTTGSIPQSGRVYVYNSAATSPTVIIDNPMPGSQARFGRSLAYFSDDVVPAAPPGEETSYRGALAIGAPGLNSVLQYNPETGELLGILQSPDNSNDSFGFSVATADTRLIVGAPVAKVSSQANAGKVYIFDRYSGILQRTISAPTATRDAFFGYDLAMRNSSELIVGTYSPGTGPGVVRIYNINTGALLYTLTSPNTKRPQFGSSVAAANGNIVVGDPLGAADASTGVAGRAYLYSLTPPTPVAPAAPSGLTASAVNDSSILLNWADNSTNETGFRVQRRTGVGVFDVITTLPAGTTTFTDTGLSADTTYFYRVQAFNAVGSSSFSNTASATTFAVTPVDFIGEVPNPGNTGDLFGFSISKVGKARFAVGAPGVDVSGTTEVGKVYVFTPPAITPTLVLNNPNPHAGDMFGYSVSSIGENILVGAPGQEIGSLGPGTAYLFNGLTGQVMFTYTDPTGLPGRQFGYSVGYYGKKQAIIGAPGNGGLGLLPGRAYLFDAKKTGALVRSFDSVTSAPNDHFGTGVAAAKGRAAITETHPNGLSPCPDGRVEIFSLKTGVFGGSSDGARGVMESKGRFLVGSPSMADCGLTPQAYLLNGIALQMLYPDPVAAKDAFGFGLAGGKKFNAIGAPLADDNNTTDTGRAYLFSAKLTTPVRTYQNPSPGVNDQFGAAMALAGKSFLAIGAPNDDAHGTDAGSVYLFNVPKK
jgi:hypothetical protein